jgi:hypothetical protein
MAFWAVVRPHDDRLAAECVAMAGFETFTPKIESRSRAVGRTTPLFAGYFFTRIVDREGDRTARTAANVEAFPERAVLTRTKEVRPRSRKGMARRRLPR